MAGRRQQRFHSFVYILQLVVFVWLTFTITYLCNSIGVTVNTFTSDIAVPQSQTPPTLRQLTSGASYDTRPAKKIVKSTCLDLNREYIVNIDAEDVSPKTLDASFDRKEKYAIPNIIHQTAKSRCVTQKVANVIKRWRSLADLNLSYYFHDDDAVQGLFQHFFHLEFPLLEPIVHNCLIDGTLKADLWRYLILWLYGGIYADIDTIPNQLNITDVMHHDAYFVVEQYHLLSQWFIAISPRHPLMYYAIQQSLSNLMRATDVGRIAAPLTTGPHALHAAFVQFRRDNDPTVDRKQPVYAGHYVGTYNRTITVVGTADQENRFVRRDALGVLKKKEYRKMGMNHFSEIRSNSTQVSCMSTMLHSIY